MPKDLLVLPKIEPDFGFESNKSLVPYDTGQPLPTANNQVNEQTQVMVAIAHKTNVALNLMSDMNQHATEQFAKTVEKTTEIKQAARNKPHKEYVEQFSDAVTQVAGQQMIGTVKVGATAIAREVSREVSPIRPEPKKRGGLRGLFGG